MSAEAGPDRWLRPPAVAAVLPYRAGFRPTVEVTLAQLADGQWTAGWWLELHHGDMRGQLVPPGMVLAATPEDALSVAAKQLGDEARGILRGRSSCITETERTEAGRLLGFALTLPSAKPPDPNPPRQLDLFAAAS